MTAGRPARQETEASAEIRGLDTRLSLGIPLHLHLLQAMLRI